NAGLAYATGDWLLHLDADEALDADGASRIRAAVDADGAGADAIEVTLANYCEDVGAWRWVATEPGNTMARGASGYIATELLRLFRNGRGFEYREAVHENITESVRDQGGVIRREPIVIHHYGYEGPESGDKTKARMYHALALKKTEQRPNDPKTWHDLGEQTLALGNAKEAETYLHRALAIDPVHLGAASTLAGMFLGRGELDEGRRIFEGLEAAGVTAPHVTMNLGMVACRQGRLAEARERLEAVLEAVPHHVIARLCMARVLDRAEGAEAARSEYQRAIAIAPKLEEPNKLLNALELRTKGERLYGAGEAGGALEAFIRALGLDPEDPILRNDAGVVLAGMGEPARARTFFEQALKLAPDLTEAHDNLVALG
ncbi:MAG: tetratricopeptide repeat protein, partial [bacterium]|nr:tetratricopeptide repeat protein [bacterium]